MSRKSKYGKCHICGKEGQLSFEHIPPKGAFNKTPIRMAKGLEVLQTLKRNDFEDIYCKIYQRGSGGYTLCIKCNNDAGAWYVNEFIDWTLQAAVILKHTKNQPTLYYPFRIFPLKVIKQIICMFFSTNAPTFREDFPELVRFVLNPEEKYINPCIKIYCYYNPTEVARKIGMAGIISKSGSIINLSEISFYPFGYLMFVDSSPPISDNEQIFDISFFADYKFNDLKEFSLKIPSHEIYTWMPGDFRNREQIKKILPK